MWAALGSAILPSGLRKLPTPEFTGSSSAVTLCLSDPPLGLPGLLRSAGLVAELLLPSPLLWVVLLLLLFLWFDASPSAPQSTANTLLVLCLRARCGKLPASINFPGSPLPCSWVRRAIFLVSFSLGALDLPRSTASASLFFCRCSFTWFRARSSRSATLIPLRSDAPILLGLDKTSKQPTHPFVPSLSVRWRSHPVTVVLFWWGSRSVLRSP